MHKLYEFAAPLGRLLISFMFVMSGISKIGGYAGTQGYMEAMGVPGMLLPLVILTEVGLGLAVIVGFKTLHCSVRSCRVLYSGSNSVPCKF